MAVVGDDALSLEGFKCAMKTKIDTFGSEWEKLKEQFDDECAMQSEMTFEEWTGFFLDWFVDDQ